MRYYYKRFFVNPHLCKVFRRISRNAPLECLSCPDRENLSAKTARFRITD
jgi:hypothetical protein